MKKVILLSLFILCNIYVSIAQSNDWFEIKDIDAAYLIDFPSEPSKGTEEVSTDKGTVTMNTYTLQTEYDDNLIYMSSFTKYPDSFFPGGLKTYEEQYEVLDNSVDGAVTNTKGELIFNQKFRLNGYNGRSIKIRISGGYIIKLKVILVDFRLYMAQVIYKEVNDNNENAERFFKSLELINVKNSW